MMHKKTSRAYPMLNLLWGSVSLVFLVVVLSLAWEKEKLSTQQQLFHAATTISNQLDRFVESLTDAVHPISQSLQGKRQCPAVTRTALEQLVFNHPELSGLVIQDRKGNIVCSTLATSPLDIPFKQPIVLYGPLRIGEKPVFVIQKRANTLLIQFYILEEVLAEKLHTATIIPQTIALHDPRNQETFLQITRTTTPPFWELPSSPLSLQEKTLSVFVKFSMLDNVIVKLTANTQAMKRAAWIDMTGITLLVLLLLFLPYYYFRTRLNHRRSVHYALSNALKLKQFIPLYQPQIDTQNNTCTGAEVLLRWSLPEEELISPELFIQDIEQSGLIIPITLQLMETAFEECRQLLQQSPNFQLAFNVSALHFSSTSFWDDFFQLCQKYHVRPHQLVLEITERDLLPCHNEALTQRMQTLRETGFTLAVDDFGTGHASLSYLKHFPFNELKIDKMFIDAIGTGAVTEALNHSIIDLARHLKLQVVAEGVETGKQIECLNNQGVYLMQGWYFAKPMSFEQLTHFILKRSPHE